MAEPLTERDLQIQVVQHLQWALPEDALVFHVPNGGSRNKLEAINLKRMGTVAGIPDLVVLHDERAFFIEMKLGKGKLSEAQSFIISRIKRARCKVSLCRSMEDVENFLSECGIPLRTESLTTERIKRGFAKVNAEAAAE